MFAQWSKHAMGGGVCTSVCSRLRIKRLNKTNLICASVSSLLCATSNNWDAKYEAFSR